GVMVGRGSGCRLIPLVERSRSGLRLMASKGSLKKLSQDLRFLIRAAHIHHNLDITPDLYSIALMGGVVAEAEVQDDLELAINPGQVFGEIKGIPGKDPAFGLDAVWIEPAQKDQAQSLGYTVVDVSTVVATHLNQILYKHSHELIGHEEVQQLLKVLAKAS